MRCRRLAITYWGTDIQYDHDRDVLTAHHLDTTMRIILPAASPVQ